MRQINGDMLPNVYPFHRALARLKGEEFVNLGFLREAKARTSYPIDALIDIN